jgi:hypothetical protein
MNARINQFGSSLSLQVRLFGVFCLLASADPRLDLHAAGVPHHFTRISVGTDHSVEMSLDGSATNLFPLGPGARAQFLEMFDMYLVDHSPDLTKWMRGTALLHRIGDSGPLSWRDTNAP